MTSDLKPRFVDKESFTLVGLVLPIAQGKTAGIPGLWDALMARQGEIADAEPGHAYGLCTMLEETEDAFEYLAGFAVADHFEPPAGMVRRRVPALHYAVFTHKADDPDLSNHLPNTYRRIFGEWLPTSGYELAAGIDFEHYDARFDPATKTGTIDIYLPVRRSA